MRRLLITLSIRLSLPLSELERLPMNVIREYVAVLNEEHAPKTIDPMKVFGNPHG